ncbi:MAG: Fe-S cluster assembly sulfur transfer protein SufU [Pseudomonadota bacterium]
MLENPQDLRELYQELILDHARHPRHFGSLDDATHSADGINPLCGDKLTVYLRVGDDGCIEEATFEGVGCAISVASASLLTESIRGRHADEVLADGDALIARLTGEAGCDGCCAGNGDADGDDRNGFDKLRALEGVKEFPARVKCATLPWRALAFAINGSSQPATTE